MTELGFDYVAVYRSVKTGETTKIEIERALTPRSAWNVAKGEESELWKLVSITPKLQEGNYFEWAKTELKELLRSGDR